MHLRRVSVRGMPFLLLWMALLASPAAAEPAQVENDDVPTRGSREARLVERWRLGYDDEPVLGVLVDAVMDAAGTVYVLDEQLGQIAVIEPGGRVNRVLSRQGEGPGELNRPRDLLWLPDSTLGVADAKPGEITWLARDGTPRDPLLLKQADGLVLRSHHILKAEWRTGTLAIGALESAVVDGERRNQAFLALVDVNGVPFKRLLTVTRGWDFSKRRYVERNEYFYHQGYWTLAPDGRLCAVLDRNRYRIDVFDATGTPRLVITRRFEPHARSKDEKQQVADGRTMILNGVKVKIDCRIEDHDPCIRALFADADGQLWVRPWRAAGEGDDPSTVVYDVFDTQGRYVERVRYAADFPLQHHRLIMFSPSRFVLLEDPMAAAEDDEPFKVICFRAK